MLHEVLIPKVGYGMTEGVLSGWSVAEGDRVEADQVIYILETDKAEVEQESPFAGYIRFAVEPGAFVEPGSLIGWIADTVGELTGDAPPGSDAEPPAVTQDQHEATSESPPDQPSTPAFTRTASPNARRLAAELGVDIAAVTGTGPNGQVTGADVQAAAQQAPAGEDQTKTRVPLPSDDTPAITEAAESTANQMIPLTGWRRSIATRLMDSAHKTAQLTTMRDIDVTALLDYRQQRKAAGDNVASVTAYLLKATALTLREFPELNGTLEDDTISRPATINIAVAVETDRGVVTPVLRTADTTSLPDIARFIDDSSRAAREGRITFADLSAGSFTLTTTGADGADWGTPLLNYPQIAILLTGRVRDTLTLDAAGIRVRKLMGLCLTYDHRAVDGVPTVRFIQQIERVVAEPEAMNRHHA